MATAAPDAVAAPVESVGLTTRGLQKRRRVRMEPAVVPYDEMLHNNRTGHCTEPVEDSGSSVTKMGTVQIMELFSMHIQGGRAEIRTAVKKSPLEIA